MKIEELFEVDMYVLVAPDGSTQLSTLSPDFPSCVAFCKILSETGMCMPPDVLFGSGFSVMPVKVTIKQNGDENKPFMKK